MQLQRETHFCPHCGHTHEADAPSELFTINITHNLNLMAEAAKLYNPLWYLRSQDGEADIEKAKQLAPILRTGLSELRAWPDKYKKFNAKNGWGKYEDFVSFVEKLLHACDQWPEADVKVSR